MVPRRGVFSASARLGTFIDGKPKRSSTCISPLAMKHLLFRAYTITATTQKDGALWRSHVVISWESGQHKKDLQDEKCFKTRREAEQHAFELGKHWVNNHLQVMQRVP